jgi:signal transduction histidine kinase
MKNSLKKKLCFTGVGLISLFVLLNILFTYFWMTPFSKRYTAKQMENLADTLMTQMDLSDEDFQSYIEQMDEDYNTTVTVVDSEQNIIATTSSGTTLRKKLGPTSSNLFQENFDILEKGKTIKYYKEKNDKINGKHTANDMSTEQLTSQGQEEDTKKMDSESVRIFVIKKIGENRYVILYRTFRSLYNATMSAILFDIIAGVIIIIIGIIVVWKLSDYVVKPVKDITEVAEHIANLEFDVKAPENGKDELSQLGSSINRMSGYLEDNLVQLQNDIDNRKKLVRNLSHEIKSPVAVIMGYAERLKAVISKNPEKAVAYCEVIADESGRIDNLVKEMLEFSKLEQRTEELVLEKVSLQTLFQSAYNRFEKENIDRKIRFTMDYDKSGYIQGDSTLLERAIHNLLGNAVAYGSLENLEIRLQGIQKENYYEIRVYNSGNGIPEEIMGNIWDAFIKADKARARGKQGSGVGLSIVREIVEAHNGYYSVCNVEGGVEFLIAVKTGSTS